LVQWPIDLLLRTSPFGLWDQEFYSTRDLLGVIVAVVVWWLYFALFESSSRRATPGKRVLGILVTDLHGNRLTFARATARNLARSLSDILFIGYLIMPFTPRKQALHDLIAGTAVIPGIL
jgi:uncharacterized RDD family membrane protein YckC